MVSLRLTTPCVRQALRQADSGGPERWTRSCRMFPCPQTLSIIQCRVLHGIQKPRQQPPSIALELSSESARDNSTSEGSASKKPGQMAGRLDPPGRLRPCDGHGPTRLDGHERERRMMSLHELLIGVGGHKVIVRLKRVHGHQCRGARNEGGPSAFLRSGVSSGAFLRDDPRSTRGCVQGVGAWRRGVVDREPGDDGWLVKVSRMLRRPRGLVQRPASFYKAALPVSSP